MHLTRACLHEPSFLEEIATSDEDAVVGANGDSLSGKLDDIEAVNQASCGYLNALGYDASVFQAM